MKIDSYEKQLNTLFVAPKVKTETKKVVPTVVADNKQIIIKKEPVIKQEPVIKKEPIVKQEVVKQELPKEDVLIQIETEEKIIVQESQNRDNKFDIEYFDHIKARYTSILTNVDKSLQVNPDNKNLTTKKNEIRENLRNAELRFRTEKEIVAWYKRQELMSDGKIQRPQYTNIADFLLGIKYLKPATGYEKFCWEDYKNKQKPINEIVFAYALTTIKSINKGKKL